LSNLDLLKNDGVLVLNKPDISVPEKTVVVLGVARGGTTMVASVLQALGVHMGERLGPVLEDVLLSESVESRNLQQFENLVAKRDAAHQIWGWKRPSALKYTDVWENSFRNPHLVVVFRDPFAIANRNRISMLSDVFKNMEGSVKSFQKLIKYLKYQKSPILLCSYEKVLSSPENFVMAVDEFLDLNAKELRSAAVKKINPASKEYLESSRITNSKGRLDSVNECFCSGWAFYPKQPKLYAKVQVFVNENLIDTIEACLPRADVKEKGLHPSGLCGFRFEWAEDIKLKVGDSINVKVEGDIKCLDNSPKSLTELSMSSELNE